LGARVEDSIAQALHWLLNSGIQERDGGVARYVRSDTGVYAQVSAEITGYFLSSLLFFKGGGSEQTRSAARYLCDTAWNVEHQVLLFEKATSERPASGYFFDCGIAGLSLLEMFRNTGESEFLSRAIDIGNSMERDFRTPRGCFAAVVTLPSKALSPDEDWWSRKPGCYQLKSAVLWRRILEHKSEPNFFGLYDKVLGWALADSGSFLSHGGAEHIMDRLHAYLYFLEGLLPVVTADKYAEEIRNGIALAASHLKAAARQFVRSDVQAQMLRLRLLSFSLGGVPFDHDALAEDVKQLLRFQVMSPNPRLHGAFVFGRELGQMSPYANPVSTIFAAQALSLWLDFQIGALPDDWRILI
jgi:hypothetical protein